MSEYLIICPRETAWRMSPETFRDRLKDKWPYSEVSLSSDSEVPLRWSLPFAGIEMLGSFHRNGLTVGLEGPFEGFANFACWYRTLVPIEVPLVLMDQGYHEVYLLTSETTPDDIISERIVLRPPPAPEDLFTHTRQGPKD